MLALLAVACAPPRPPDPNGITAVYKVGGWKDPVTIKVADNGDWRFDRRNAGEIRYAGIDYQYSMWIDMRVYSYTKSDADAVEASRRQAPGYDAHAGELRPGSTYRLPGGAVFRVPAEPVHRFEAVETGEEVVAGRRGKRWTVREIGRPKGRSIEVVIGNDPWLAPIAPLTRRFITVPDEARSDSYEARVAEVAAKGVVLRLGSEYVLESAERTMLRSADFTPPGKRLTRADLERREPIVTLNPSQ